MQVVTISVIDTCPLNCPSCYSNKSPKKMSLVQFKKIIDQLPAADITSITLTGGEPLLLGKTLVDMCSYCSDVLVKPVIFSSGIVLDGVDLDALQPHISSIHVTIKYPNHLDNAWKGLASAHDNAKKFIRKCHDAKITVFLHFCADIYNSMYFDEMLQFKKACGANKIHVLRFLPFDKEDSLFALSDTRWESFCEKIHSYDEVDILYPSKYSSHPCVAGITRMNILTNGDVTGCIYLSSPIIGNILKEGYIQIEQKLEQWRVKRGAETECIAKQGLAS